MNIQLITWFNNNTNVFKNNNTNTTNPIQQNSDTNLNSLPNYGYQVNFQATNVEIIEKMQTLVKSKNYKFEELTKLFNELSDKAKANINGAINIFKKEGLNFNNYLLACIDQKQLFYCSPNTVEKHIMGIVQKFEKEVAELMPVLFT